jgi:hypothetical protein
MYFTPFWRVSPSLLDHPNRGNNSDQTEGILGPVGLAENRSTEHMRRTRSSLMCELEVARKIVADQLGHSVDDLQPLEGLGRSEIYASVNKETLTISQSAAPLIIAGQAVNLSNG